MVWTGEDAVSPAWVAGDQLPLPADATYDSIPSTVTYDTLDDYIEDFRYTTARLWAIAEAKEDTWV